METPRFRVIEGGEGNGDSEGGNIENRESLEERHEGWLAKNKENIMRRAKDVAIIAGSLVLSRMIHTEISNDARVLLDPELQGPVGQALVYFMSHVPTFAAIAQRTLRSKNLKQDQQHA